MAHLHTAASAPLSVSSLCQNSSTRLQCRCGAHSSVQSGHSGANIDLRASGRNEEAVLIHQHIVVFLFFLFLLSGNTQKKMCDRKCTDLNISSATLALCQRTFALV